MVLGRKDYNPQHELIAYGWYGSHRFERSTAKSVIFCPKPTKAKLHPTMKPVEVIAQAHREQHEDGRMGMRSVPRIGEHVDSL